MSGEIFQRSPRAVHRVVDGEAVIVEPAIGMVTILNDVGARVWESLDGRQSAAEIAAAIAEEYAVPPAEAAADVTAFLAELMEKGLINRHDDRGNKN